MASQNQTKNMQTMISEYTGIIDLENESVAVNAFPPIGGRHILTVTGGKPNMIYYIKTRSSKNKGVARRKCKTEVIEVTTSGNEFTYKTRVSLMDENEIEEQKKEIHNFIKGFGKVPRENEVKTVDDFKKFFIYSLCGQAAILGFEEIDSTEDFTKNEECVESTINFDDRVNNTVKRYAWTKKGSYEQEEIKSTREIDYSLIPLTDKLLILKGEMQSGKTMWMITRSLMDVYKGRTALVILRDLNGDQIQLVNRIRKVNKDFIETARDKFNMEVGNIVEHQHNIGGLQGQLCLCPHAAKQAAFVALLQTCRIDNLER